MGSGASILDHSNIKASTKDKKVEKANSKTEIVNESVEQSNEETNTPTIEVAPLVQCTSENYYIFEEPVVDADLAEMERKIDERAARRLSRNIVSGEILGNVLQAQFSMKSLSSSPNGGLQHHEYVLQKTISTEAEGDKLHATSIADLRKNMREKLTNELQPPIRTVSCIEGIDLPSLQELKPRKSGLDTFTSMPNLAPIPPIGKAFVVENKPVVSQ